MSQLPLLNPKDLYCYNEVGNSACCMLLLGSTRAGKTYLLNDLYKKTKLRDKPGALFSNSLSSPSYDYFRDKLACFYDFNKDVLNELVNINRKTKNHYSFVCFIDDDNNHVNSKIFNSLFLVHRNNNINSVYSTQSYACVSKKARSNFSYIFFGAMNTDEQIECIMQVYLGSYFDGTMPEKIEAYRELTENNWFLFLNNFNGQLYRYKAD